MKSYRCYEMKNYVRANRISYGLSQKQLAILIGTTQNTISSIERNEYQPSAYLAALLCDVLKCPFDEMFYFEYEGVKAHFDHQPRDKDAFIEYKRGLFKELEWHRKFDEELERISTMDPFFE